MSYDLIYTRKNTYSPLSLAEVYDACPAAFAPHASPETSERYGFVSTASAIDILADYGFAPVRAAQKPVRKAALLPYADHLIAFKPVQSFEQGGQESPEILLYNSHNGKSALKLFAGAFRFVCSNGIVAGEGFNAKLRHSRLTAEAFAGMVAEQAQALPDLLQKIYRLKETQWEREQAVEFAYNAAKLRWEIDPSDPTIGDPQALADDEKLSGSYASRWTLRDLNTSHRYDDSGSDAWRTFNRVQEGLIRGGVRVRSYSDRNVWGRTRTAKAVSSLPENVRINRSLWDMADALA